jgi:hypothetical protein
MNCITNFTKNTRESFRIWNKGRYDYGTRIPPSLEGD